METHSLFSLEIVIEKLYLPNIQCRFPTVACKLLNFPIININLMDKGKANSIKDKMKSSPEWAIPDQFNYLKDREDTFRFENGKSCLFKISPQKLKSLLLNVPLYVMVLDTWPSPPKLTGNASVPLDKAIEKICKDLHKNGPDVPVVYRNTGLLRVYNLMAKEVGYMTFGYRLLYLGTTLLPHLSVEQPKADVLESEQLLQDVPTVEEVTTISKVNNQMNGSKETNNEIGNQAGILGAISDVGDVRDQETDLKNEGCIMKERTGTKDPHLCPKEDELPLKSPIKTERLTKKKIQEGSGEFSERMVREKKAGKNPEIPSRTKMLAKDTVEETVTSGQNMIILEELLSTKKDSINDCKDQIAKKQIPIVNDQILNDFKNGGDKDPFELYCPPPISYRKINSRILSVDQDFINNEKCDLTDKKQSSKENVYSKHCKIQPNNNNNNNKNINQNNNNNEGDILPNEDKIDKLKKVSKTDAQMQTVTALLSIEPDRYPYLNGVLKELSSIDIPGVLQQILGNIRKQNTKRDSERVKSQARNSKSKQYTNSPRKQTPTSARENERRMPKNKSWIRCTQHFMGKKSSLEYGLTKTHLLRLDQLRLHEEEEEEEEAERKKRQKLRKESRLKKQVCKNCLKLSKNGPKLSQEELVAEKIHKSIQVGSAINFERKQNISRNEVNSGYGRDSVYTEYEVGNLNQEQDGEINFAKPENEEMFNGLNAVEETILQGIKRDENKQVNGIHERNKPIENKVNVLSDERMNAEREMKNDSQQVITPIKNDRQKSRKNEVDLWDNESMESGLKGDDPQRKNTENEAEDLALKFIKESQTKSEENNRKEILNTFPDSKSADNESKRILSDKTIKDNSIEDRSNTCKESAEIPKNETEDEFGNFDEENQENSELYSTYLKESQNEDNRKRNSVVLEKWSPRQESFQDSLNGTKNDNQPTIKTQQIKENQNVPSFENTPKSVFRQSLSSIAPPMATSPRPRYSRGPSIQESNASSSSIPYETPVPTPRARRLPFMLKKESIHTDSVSSYRPSEDNDEMVSPTSSKHSKSAEDYSDDFMLSESETNSEVSVINEMQEPKILSENKLGYTIW